MKNQDNNLLIKLKWPTVIIGFIRILFSTVLSLAITYIIEEVSSEVVLIWYMKTNGVVNRSELANDYGFGMLGFFISIFLFIISFSILFVVAWKFSKKIIKRLDIFKER